MKKDQRGKKNPNFRHGQATGKYSELYKVWDNMMQRCYNPKNKRYEKYGGRGIKVCDEWLNKKSFFNWSIKQGYNPRLQIDRIDNYKGYSPSNCRYVTRHESVLNKIKKPMRGIYRRKCGHFEIAFTRNGKRIYCGTANSLEMAIILRDLKEKEVNQLIIII